MNAVLKSKPAAPRTAESLAAQVRRLETQVAELRRTENGTRAARPGIVADGDEDAIRLTNQTIEECAARIKGLLEEIETTQAALQVATERERTDVQAQTYLKLKTAIDVTRADVEEIQACAIAFVLAYEKATKGIDTLDAQLSRAGITPDPYVLKAKLHGVTQLCLHVESGGVFGLARTIESIDELRKNGRASLKSLAASFHALTLRQAKASLRVRD
jgi:hypothetical protein